MVHLFLHCQHLVDSPKKMVKLVTRLGGVGIWLSLTSLGVVKGLARLEYGYARLV